MLVIHLTECYNEVMKYETFKENLLRAGITNTELARAFGVDRQVITRYNQRGVPACMAALSDAIAQAAEQGVDKASILACAKHLSYDGFRELITKVGMTNVEFAHLIQVKSRSISDYKRQQVPICSAMLAGVLVLANLKLTDC